MFGFKAEFKPARKTDTKIDHKMDAKFNYKADSKSNSKPGNIKTNRNYDETHSALWLSLKALPVKTGTR